MNWQPIETAPKDGSWLMGAEKDWNEDGRGKYDWTYFMIQWSIHTDRWLYYRAGECWYPLDLESVNLTHWSPLPDAPK